MGRWKGEWEMKAKRLLCLWSALALALMTVCLGIAAWDVAALARTGEFQLLPALNVRQFRSDGSLDEEDAEALTGAVAFDQELYETGHDERDPLWKFINISTWIALLQLPLFFLFWMFDVRAPRWAKAAFAISFGIALLLILGARLCARDAYGGFIIEMCYSAAYIDPRALLIPIFALLVLALIFKCACPEEGEAGEEDHPADGARPDGGTETCADAAPLDRATETCADAAPLDRATETCADAAPLDRATEACADAAPLDRATETCADAARLDGGTEACADAAPLDGENETCADATRLDRATEICVDAARLDRGNETCADAAPLDRATEACADEARLDGADEACAKTQRPDGETAPRT